MEVPGLSRRGLLKLGLGAAAVGGLPRRSLAQPAAEKSAVVILWFDGGFSTIFSAADSYLAPERAWFGVTSSNIVDIGGGVFVDKDTFGTLPPEVKAHMGVVGSRFGWSDHNFGSTKPWMLLDGSTSNPVMLARVMGGGSPLRYAHIGGLLRVDHDEKDGVFCTPILDLARARALVTGAAAPGLPSASMEALGLDAMLKMSRRRTAASPARLRDYNSGLRGLANVLRSPPLQVDWEEIARAYGIDPASSSLEPMSARCAAAELMVRYGTDVVTITVPGAAIAGGGWDSHGDIGGALVRSEMTRLIMPALPTFLSRMLRLPGYNVVVAVLSHFARNGDGGNDNHGSTLSSPVFGKYLKNATTGREDASMNGLPLGDVSVREYWSLLADAARVPGQPFGPHSHGGLLL